jgi:hypothetical protein
VCVKCVCMWCVWCLCVCVCVVCVCVWCVYVCEVCVYVVCVVFVCVVFVCMCLCVWCLCVWCLCVCVCVWCVCVWYVYVCCAAAQIRVLCGTSQFVPWSNMINSDDRPLKRVWSDDRPLTDKDKCKARILISAATRYLSHKNDVLRTRWSEFEFQTGILQAFFTSRETTLSFVASVRLSVRMERLGSHWADFHKICYLSVFRKSVDKI